MIHSERDLFSSVAFFAKKKKKKGWTKGFMWGDFLFFFFFSPPPGEPDLVLFCGWRDRSGTQCLQRAGQAVCTKLPPKKKSAPTSGTTFYISCFPLHCQAEKIITNDGGLETKQQKKTPQQTTVKLPELLVSPAGGGRWRAGGRPGGGRSSAVTPLRPRGAVPGWKPRDGWAE